MLYIEDYLTVLYYVLITGNKTKVRMKVIFESQGRVKMAEK